VKKEKNSSIVTEEDGNHMNGSVNISESKKGKYSRDAEYWKSMEGCSAILDIINNNPFIDLLCYDTDPKYSIEKINEKLVKGIYNSENHFLLDFNNLFDKALENKFLDDDSLKQEINKMKELFDEHWVNRLTEKNNMIIEENYINVDSTNGHKGDNENGDEKGIYYYLFTYISF